MKNNIKKSKEAITLISLILTIVLLIILSIISIRIITKDDTVSNAEKVAKDYLEAETINKIQLAYKDLQSEQLINLNFDDTQFLKDKLNYYGIEDATVTTNDSQYIVVINEKSYILSKGTGLAQKEKQISEYPEIQPNVTATENSRYVSDNKIAIIPAGYTVSEIELEQSIDNGLVVKDSSANEWVWIPVNDADFAKLFAGAADDGWIMSGTSIKTKYKSNSDIIEGINRTNPGNSSEDSYREPDIVEVDDDPIYFETMGFNKIKTISELAQTIKIDYEKMMNSIKKHKGFYVGRYEISDSGVKKNQYPCINETWYSYYNKCKQLGKESTESRMIWGCQWDQTCRFISQYKEGNQIKTRDLANSTSYGNYATSTESGHGIIQTTGFNEVWKTNKIYDLAGNCFEWTQEASYSDSRTLRGGSASGINNSVLERSADIASGSNPGYSTRPMLYIK